MNIKLSLVVAACFALAAPGCKKSEAKPDSKAAATAPAAKPAAATATPAAAKKATPTKGGGKSGAQAKESKQKLAESLKSKQSAAKKRDDSEVEGLDCNDELDGLAWCGSDSELIFCSEGEWYALDCSEVEEGAFCGFDVDALEVSCFSE